MQDLNLLWSWSLILIADPDPWSWSLILIPDPDPDPWSLILILILIPDPDHVAQGSSEAISSRSWRLDLTDFGEVDVEAGWAPSSSSWSRWWWNLSSWSRLRRNSLEKQAPKAGGCARGNRGDWGHKGTLGRQERHGRHERHRRQGRLKKLTSGITHWANL